VTLRSVRTLRATIDWSYGLLEPVHADAFVRFAVFAAGATIDAAKAVTGASTEALEALVAKSLIDRRVQPDHSVRLVMLDTIREYACERLAADPQREAVERRFLGHYLQLVEHADVLLSTSEEAQALAGLDLEIDNILTALRRAIRAQPAKALRLTGHLGEYWSIRGDPESLTWLDAALHAAGGRHRLPIALERNCGASSRCSPDSSMTLRAMRQTERLRCSNGPATTTARLRHSASSRAALRLPENQTSNCRTRRPPAGKRDSRRMTQCSAARWQDTRSVFPQPSGFSR
jgi:hypothetical protein